MEFTIKVLVRHGFLHLIGANIGFIAFLSSLIAEILMAKYGAETYDLDMDFPGIGDKREYFTVTVRVPEKDVSRYKSNEGLLGVTAWAMRKFLIESLGTEMYTITIEGKIGTRKVNEVATTR